VTGAEQAAHVARVLSMRNGTVAVLGLAQSGEAVTRLLRHVGVEVYASDSVRSEATDGAAQRLRALGADCDVGSHDVDRVMRADFVVVSPGIPPTAPVMAAALRAGTPVVSEVEVALRLMPSVRVIAVTGTNGKSTTTALIAHLLRSLGLDAEAGGNIGVPVSTLAMRQPQPAWLALEISSFQLHDTPGIQPTVGVLTSLSPDHLDRYASVAAYYADKARLFANATDRSQWVWSADSTDVAEMTATVRGTHARFSLQHADADASYDRRREQLIIDGQWFIARDDIPLLGDHNVANVLAALLAVRRADTAFTTEHAHFQLIDGVRSFRALPHRLEPVIERDGVLWVNDSKATNVDSTLVAVQGMTRPTVLLLGGRHKGEPYSALAPAIDRMVHTVLCYGEAGERAYHDLRGVCAPAVRVEWMREMPFDEVVRVARGHARPGDTVLLSPACSSFDMFQNYVARGNRFAELARTL
jgi:UDP-N-acetylmuramoylalanine--D-glutamate ligase